MRPMRLLWLSRLTLPLLVFAGCRLVSAQLTPSAKGSVRPGTYALHICRVICDAAHPANIIEDGFIVLDTAPIGIAATSNNDRRLFTEMRLLAPDTGMLNGCYMLATRRSVPTYAHGWGGPPR